MILWLAFSGNINFKDNKINKLNLDFSIFSYLKVNFNYQEK